MILNASSHTFLSTVDCRVLSITIDVLRCEAAASGRGLRGAKYDGRVNIPPVAARLLLIVSAGTAGLLGRLCDARHTQCGEIY